MKIALLGGSGASGKYILRKFLDNNYNMRILVRNPQSIQEFREYKNLEVIIGDALNQNDINSLVKGCDAVISALGHRKGSPPDLLEKSMGFVIEEMKKNKVTRLVCITGAGVSLPGDNPSIIDKFITKMITLIDPARINDGFAMSKKVINSNLDWTIVRTQLQHNYNTSGKRNVGLVGDKGQSWKCSRNYIADFIFECISEKKYIQKYPMISD